MAAETTVRDGIAFVRLAEPAQRNALSSALLADLHAAADLTVSAFVITGSDGFFSAGADVAELASGAWLRPEGAGPPELFRRITEDPRPWIAAVNGPAIGGGCELALSCDFVLMTETAWLRLPEASLGVIPNTAVKLLHGRLGHARAMSVLLGLEKLAARQAVDAGIATAVHDDVGAAASALAARVLSSTSPAAFRLVKTALRTESVSWPDSAALLSEVDRDDVRAGIAAMRDRERTDYTPRWATVKEKA